MTKDASDKDGSGLNSVGIPGLPKKWQGPVQIVSTFGLAVFLVLYYLFVIRPENNARYQKMRESIDKLQHVVQAEQAVVSEEQAERLEDLYIDAVSPRVADILMREMPQQEKIDQIERHLLTKTDNLRGIIRESGRSLAEQLRTRLRPANPDDPNVASIIVREAADNNVDPKDPKSVGSALRAVLRPRAMAK